VAEGRGIKTTRPLNCFFSLWMVYSYGIEIIQKSNKNLIKNLLKNDKEDFERFYNDFH
jgi:hypothetical protein